jgi:uncharacterized Fe-S cluster-containing radical SAM superfamily protein
MASGFDPVASIKTIRTIAKRQGAFAFADLTGDQMPDVVSDTFRIFTPHKPEKHRVDNGKEGESFDIFRDTVFDYPSIIQSKLGGPWDQYNSLLSGQVAYCNFHCWYCYVPDELLRGGKAQYLTSKEIVDRFLQLRNRKGMKCSVLRITGGEPFLVPELILECLQLIEKAGLAKEVFVWSETNLSPFLSEGSNQPTLVETWLNEVGNKLEDFAAFDNFALHPCLHGTDESNFHQTTLARDEFFSRLVNAFRTLVQCGIDIYPTISSNASPSDNLEKLFLDLKSIHPSLPLRFALITDDFNYPPIDERLSRERRTGTIYGKRIMITKWNKLIRQNYKRDYAEIPRKDVKLV